MEVQEDFKLATAADIVSNPSAPAAFVNGILEGAEWVYDIGSGMWVENVQTTAKVLKQQKTITEEDQLRIFQSFMSKLLKR